MSWLIIFCIVFILFVTWWYYKFLQYGQHFTKYKGPKPLLLVGNMHQIPQIEDFIPAIMRFHKQFGPLVKIWFGYFPRLFISDYKTAEMLLKSNTILEKAYEYYFFQPWLGLGILTSTGTEWRKQRKLITPGFHFQILEQFITIFDNQSKILVEKLREFANSDAIDIYPYVNLFALDVICEATMGTKVNAQKQSDSSYVSCVREICKVMSERTVSLVNYYDVIYEWSKDYVRQKKALSVLHGHSNLVIKLRQTKLKNMPNNVNKEYIETKRRPAFLDLLLECRVDGAPLPPEHIREQVDTIMFEGHDTTSSGIAFTLYCLSRNKSAQEKVVEELHALFGHDKDSVPTHHDLNDMKYLEMVIKESMRLYPPVPVFARQMSVAEEFDGTVFPKGSTFSIFVYGLHRQEEVYPDPEKFDPERFTPENCINRPTFAYVPFSAGPRNCIGQRFAMYEMKSVISSILRNFELLPVIEHTPKVSLEIILKSINGLPMYIKERKF